MLRVIVLMCTVLGVLWPPSVRAAPVEPVVAAPEAIVMDGWTGQVLWSRRADVPRYPGSTIKIMTALLILERHVPLSRVVTVSAFAASYGGSTAGLYPGERLTVWDLLHGMLLPSGNDAAVAVAQIIAPSIPAFSAIMNRRARRLRMWHTHYLSANGFDQLGQVSSARDLAIVARFAMRFRAFRRIVRTRVWRAPSNGGPITHVWYNTNQLLGASSAVDGVKTGTTPGAGACLVSSARKDGRWIIAVNMDSPEALRFADGAALLNYGFLAEGSMPSAR